MSANGQLGFALLRNSKISSALAYHFLLAESSAVLFPAFADLTTSAEIAICAFNN
jgi:hypothetical protein